MSATRFGTRWGIRGGVASRATTTMVDQCVASASNFSVGIVVARITGPAGLGAFALAYTVWILLTTMNRSLITDPMAIMGDMRHEDRDGFVRRGFAANVTLGVVAACIVAGYWRHFPLCRSAHVRDRPPLRGSVDRGARSAGLLALDRLHAGDAKEIPGERPAVQCRASSGLRGCLCAGRALRVRRRFSLGPGAAIVAAAYGLRQFAVRPSIRGSSIPLGPLADEPVVGR